MDGGIAGRQQTNIETRGRLQSIALFLFISVLQSSRQININSIISLVGFVMSAEDELHKKET